eukprot:1105194-Prorocentrum_minimum.AAC.1
MSKKIRKLEKENLGLREKTAKSDVAMINLLDERTNYAQRAEEQLKKNKALEGLCRSLQVRTCYESLHTCYESLHTYY